MAGAQSDGAGLLNMLQSSSLVVPDELTQYLLRKAGADCHDERTVRLVSLAAQSFLATVLEDARVIQSNRMQAPAAHLKAEGLSTRDKRPTLLTEDLAKALQQYGLNLQRPPFHVQR